MLEQMRQNSRNVVIYVLFGVIIAVFVINFGPGSRGLSTGPSGHSVAANVGSSTLTEQDFRFAYIALGGTQFPIALAKERRLKEFVMDKLIERELLAAEAEKLGFQVSAKEVEEMIADGRMLVMGVPRRVDSSVFKDGKFDYERFKMMSQNQLGVSVLRFIEIERRELLAERMREMMKSGTKVSLDEVKDEFEQKGLQVNLEFVRFSQRRHEEESQVTAAEIDAYVKAHGDELKKQFEERSFLYKKVDKHVKGRSIVVDVAKDADKATEEAAQKQIDAAAAKVKSGAPFAKVAEAVNTDARAKKHGGAFAFRKKGFTGFGDGLDTKVFAAKAGEVVGPERTERGFALVLVEEFREGDVPVATAERELAEEAAKRENAKTKAKADAEVALAKVRAGAKLEELFPKKKDEENKQPPGAFAAASDAPALKETGLFPRRGEALPEIGLSKDLAKKAFDLKVGEIAGPFEASGAWVIARVKEHKDPDLTDYEKRKEELLRQYERTKWAEVLDAWSKQRCSELHRAKQITVTEEILSYEVGQAPQTNKAPQLAEKKYEPCAGTKLF